MKERKDIVARKEAIPQRGVQLPAAVLKVDIYENDDEILMFADMPGVAKDDIRVNLDNGALTLSGVRRFDASGTVSREEFGEAEYGRTFSVPQAIDIDRVKAELKEGVLRLHLPKSEAAKPRHIEIKAA